ncbi:MAG: ATP synthase F1 subunit epsilon [Polyangia bacterium]
MKVEVVTPTGTAVSTDADELIAPGVAGEFGVLPGHTPFMSAMKPGVLKYKTGGKMHHLAVGAGLVEVSGDERVVVITERTAMVEDIDVSAARRELEEADTAARAGDKHAEQKRQWAQAQLDAVAKRSNN